MVRRLKDYEWTFSNTAEGMIALLLSIVIVAVLA